MRKGKARNGQMWRTSQKLPPKPKKPEGSLEKAKQVVSPATRKFLK